MWEPRCLTTLWASASCYRDNFTFRRRMKEDAEVEKKTKRKEILIRR
jgi:hypothetical protein